MRKNAEKMDLSSRNRLLRVPAGSHGFWAHDPLPNPSHDLHVDPRRVTIPLAFTSSTDRKRKVCQPIGNYIDVMRSWCRPSAKDTRRRWNSA